MALCIPWHTWPELIQYYILQFHLHCKTKVILLHLTLPTYIAVNMKQLLLPGAQQLLMLKLWQ